MKFTRSTLVLSLFALLGTVTAASAATAGTFDSKTATFQKDGTHMVKVMVKKDTYTAPVSFEDGADWSAVKDHYEVTDSVVSGLAKHKIAVKIGADGKASFTRKK